jgi:GR25 family glycosyltransferase involved in LPS biosynthesis
MLHQYFDKIYYINLDKDIKRRERCEELFKQYGIKAERFAGIDLQKEKENYLNHIPPNNKLNDGEIGCFLSHLLIIKEAKKCGYKNVLIFEDDIEFQPNFIDLFEKFIKQLPQDWGLLYLSGNHIETPHLISQNIMKIKKTLTTHSYAIKEEIYDIILQHPKLFQLPLDTFYAEYIQANYPSYCFYPHLTYQRPSHSHIQNQFVNYAFIEKYQLPLTINYFFKRPSDAIGRIAKKFASVFKKFF